MTGFWWLLKHNLSGTSSQFGSWDANILCNVTAILVTFFFFLKFCAILAILNWYNSNIVPPSEQVLMSAHFCREKIFVPIHPNIEL